MPDTSGRDPVRASLESLAGPLYDEGTFRHFLANERARADRANRPLWLLLVERSTTGKGQSITIEPAVAAKILDALRAAVRETDIVGWHRADRVVGAILADRLAGVNGSHVVAGRVSDALQKHLSSRIAEGLRVRIVDGRPGSPSRAR